MLEIHEHPVPDAWKRKALIDDEAYRHLYAESVTDPEGFWARQAREFLHLECEWDTVVESDLARGEARWFSGARLNVSVNCIEIGRAHV